MGCCVGGLSKPQPIPDRTLRTPQKKNSGQSSRQKRRQWSTSPEVMENNVSISYSVETHNSSGPTTVNEDSNVVEENTNNGSFINQAAIAWNEMRRDWVGDRSNKSHRAPREPIISWCMTYDDLLSTNQPFPQPIPLSDFLIVI
ncbi:uncharacterized protein LOC103714135 isoform X2 [Phoenix dactylifera]|uniref:Uncharacterized protein LOC103714135 isoform X2 n=1 Tax=Phoenix dactylifera TaxID=42345 RepID=A0A8B7CI07_PHODC|nr:uncharacterized protein LOC103714135 isoform X2 [Phoenix dactylifera]